MQAIWRRYKPFLNSGIQILMAYRIHFILYRIADLVGVVLAYYLWKAIYQASQQSLIQGFTFSEMTIYIIMGFITNLLIGSDSSFMIGEEVKDGSIIMRLLRPVHFTASILFTEIGIKSLIFLGVGFPFLLITFALRLAMGASFFTTISLTILYLISLILAFLINFFFNISFGFSAFVLKNLWGTNLLKNSLVAFLSGNMIPLVFFPKSIAHMLTFLPFSSLIYTPVMIVLGKFSPKEILITIGFQIFWLVVMVCLSQLIWKKVQNYITIQGG